jgi:quercetin dioxygenase-like cupin family protein
MEIRRFGVGYRRHEGPAGSRGVDGQSIHADDRGAIAEIAFRPNAMLAPHSNPNLAYFVVVEGGGFVQVGEEHARVAAGEAVVWPPNVVHAAWTELTPMRVLVVEFAAEGADTLLLESGPAMDARGHSPEEPAAAS